MKSLNSSLLRLRCLCVLLFAVLLADAAAQAADATKSLFETWRWVQFTTQSGLPSNHVTDIIDTPEGRAWAVTAEGLAWYDGYQWHAIDMSSELSCKRPTRVSADDHDGLIVVAANALYRVGAAGMRRVSMNSNGQPICITSAVALLDGALLVVGEDPESGQESIWREKEGDVTRAPRPPELRELSEPRLWRTRDGAVWPSVVSRLYRWTGGRWELRLDTGTVPAKFDCIVEDATAGGLTVLRFQDGHSRLAEWGGDGNMQINEAFRYDEFLAFDVDSTGTAYALEGSGLLWIRDGKDWRILDPVPRELYSINFLKVRPNGDLWVGSKLGLLLHRRSDRRWTYWRHGDGRPEDQIAEVFQARDGSVWLGTGFGVEVRRPDGTVERVAQIDGTELGRVIGIGEDSAGNIWISSGSSFSGAFRWDGRQWRHFGPAEGLDAPFVHKIRADRAGRLWFLGIGPITEEVRDAGPGAFVYVDGRFERWGPDEGLLNGRVYSFAQTSDQALWFGTARGISRWRDGTWTHWQRLDGLRADRIFTMAVDQNDTVWFGHQRAGLGYIDASDKPAYLTTADGLVDDRVWDLQVDSQDRLWVSTSDGFCCFDDGNWWTYSTDDGLSSARLFPIYAAIDKVFVGTRSSGTSILDLSVEPHPPRVILDPVVLDGTTVAAHWSAFSHGGLVAPDDLKTRYRLDKEAWSPWGKSREFSRRDISYGSHSIAVQAKGFLPGLDAAGETLAFEVVQPFYRRTAVVLPSLVFVTSLIGLTGFLLVRRRAHAMALIRERSRAEQTFRSIAEGTAAATGSDFFHSLVRHLALAIGVRYAFLTEHRKEEDGRLHSVAFWTGDGFADNFAYDVKGKPCEDVLRGVERYHPEHLQEKFPEARILSKLCAQSYLGIPVRNSSGKILGHLGVMDVAPMVADASRLGIMRVFATRAAAELERRDTAIELQSAKEAAEAADRAKSEFLSHVSHEIRTPIMAMLGATELIESNGGQVNGRLDVREVILRNGKHLVALVDDLLNATRVESGKFDIKLAVCSLCEILADIHASIATVQRDAQVEFKIVLESAIPSVVRSDATRLRQALINLVNNAFKCTEKGHVHVFLRVESDDKGPTLIIRVEDTGRGIAKEDQGRIFNRFVQVGPRGEEAISGMGLGLPLARSIVEQLGGSLDVESEMGTGSTFTLKLPLDPVNDAEWIDADAVESRLVGSPRRVRLRGRVLIAEDFRDSRELLQYALSRAGAEVTAVTNGLDAVNAAAAHSFDLIILDIRMPKMDGLTAATEMRRLGSRGPIIALTASVGPDARDRVLDAGFDDMWSKPMTLESVIASAADYLQSAEQAEHLWKPATPSTQTPQLAAAVSAFVQSLEARLENLRSLVKAGDVVGAREILHQLVGAGGLHGFMELSTEAARLHELAKNDSLAHRTSELHALEMIVASSHKTVEQSR